MQRQKMLVGSGSAAAGYRDELRADCEPGPGTPKANVHRACPDAGWDRPRHLQRRRRRDARRTQGKPLRRKPSRAARRGSGVNL